LYDHGNAEQNIWILASCYPIKIGLLPQIGEFDKVLTDNKAPVEFLIATELLNEPLDKDFCEFETCYFPPQYG